MKKRNGIPLFIVSLGCLLGGFSNSAHALVHLNLMAGPTYYNASRSSFGVSSTLKAKVGYDLGASLSLSVAPFFEAELGALYGKDVLQDQTVILNAGTSGGTTFNVTSTLNSEMTRVNVPLLLKFTALPFIDLAAGGYFSQGLGQIEGTQKVEVSSQLVSADQYSTTGIDKATRLDYGSSTLSKQDYGAVGCVRLYYDVMPLTRLFLDGRYLFGIKNRSAVTGIEFKTRSAEALAGIGFGF